MPRLGDILLKARHLDERQLQAALDEQRRRGGRLGETLLRMNYVSEPQLLEALAFQLGISVAEADALERPEPAASAHLPYELARKLRALPLRLGERGTALLVAMVEPQNLKLVDELRKATGCRIAPQLVGARTFWRLLGAHYGVAEEVDSDEPRIAPAEPAPPSSKRSDAAIEREAPPPAAHLDDKPSADNRSAAELLAQIEEAQRAEVASLRAMVELLIERGVFSREDYLARVKR